MNVQELIEKLEEVEDKEREVTIFIGNSSTNEPIVFDIGSGNVAIGD